MLPIKEKLITLIEVMPNDDAEDLFNYIKTNYKLMPKTISWDNIKEVEPDNIDLAMLEEIKSDPECNKFISQEDLLKEMNL